MLPLTAYFKFGFSMICNSKQPKRLWNIWEDCVLVFDCCDERIIVKFEDLTCFLLDEFAHFAFKEREIVNYPVNMMKYIFVCVYTYI